MDEITLHAAQTVNREQLQHCIYRRNVVCVRYIIVTTLHKGDCKDNDVISVIIGAIGAFS
jgi:hypothetical protein